MEELLTAKEAAERLGVKPAAIYLAMKQGRLPYVTVLGKQGIRPADLANYQPRAYRDRPGAKPKGQSGKAGKVGKKALQATEEGSEE